LGIGEVDDKTFITDLENDMDEGNTVWAKPGMSVEDVIKAGLKTGIFVVNPSIDTQKTTSIVTIG
jgi:hypothetical protein